MPIYEYRCLKCGEEFEELVLSSSHEVRCPKCSKAKLERLLSTCSYKSEGKLVSPGSSNACTSCTSRNCSNCH